VKSVERITTGFDGDRWFVAPEAVAYDMADEVIGGPAGAPESSTPA
jgi:ATP-dependent protease ClpP protease subunit